MPSDDEEEMQTLSQKVAETLLDVQRTFLDLVDHRSLGLSGKPPVDPYQAALAGLQLASTQLLRRLLFEEESGTVVKPVLDPIQKLSHLATGHTYPPPRPARPAASKRQGSARFVSYVTVTQSAPVVEAVEPDVAQELNAQLHIILKGFDGSSSRLCEVFNVSRQTTHSWFTGAKTPRARHLGRIAELAKAAAVFLQGHFAVSSAMLDWPLLNERSFLELIAEEGTDGEDAARRLMQVKENDARLRKALLAEHVLQSLRKARV